MEQECIEEYRGRPGEVYVGCDTWVSPFRLRRHTSDIRRLMRHLPLITEAEDLEGVEAKVFWLNRLPRTEIDSFYQSVDEVGRLLISHADALEANASEVSRA